METYRTYFHERLNLALQDGGPVAVVALTLDHYQGIKTSLGPEACCALLKHVTAAMCSCLREGDTLVRLLGNEFALILPGLVADDDILPLLARLLDAVKEPMQWQGRELGTTASIGIAMSGDSAEAPGLLRLANVAAAHAAGLGGNRFRFCAQEMNERAARRMAMEVELRRAINYAQLQLLCDGPGRAEAKLCWRHPARGLIGHRELMALAGSCGLAIPLVALLVREACRQQRAWRDAGLSIAPVTLRLSPRQFHTDGLVEHIEVMLDINQLPRNMLVIELEGDESHTMQPLWRAINN
ncbi:diguanylate cyclase domain-containing protein [Pseudoduganella sp. OTU4001]|uniref:diguanylate cyclase domain-containing protein n=1 Tax=Pseudoduganella sp. OTU4001 TaxID=3043854 RepID=UPI00313B2E68